MLKNETISSVMAFTAITKMPSFLFCGVSFFLPSFFFLAAIPPFQILSFVLLLFCSTTGQNWGWHREPLQLLCQTISISSPLALSASRWDLLSMSYQLRWGLMEPALSADNPKWQTQLKPLWGQDLQQRGTAMQFCSGCRHGCNNMGLKFYILLFWNPFFFSFFFLTFCGNRLSNITCKIYFPWDKAVARRQEQKWICHLPSTVHRSALS